MKDFILSLAFLSVFATSYAQSDTLFWFVAPTATSAHGNSPILFRIAGGSAAATVTIDMPANPGFVPVVQAVGAGAGVSVDLTASLGIIENTPANTVLNRGLRVRATRNISVYYEVNHGNNPEIYALKGENALGTSFMTPFQTTLSNGAFTPEAKSAIDIVATENGTVVTIIPSNAVVGGAAGVPIVVTLNKGQTYSVVQANTAGSGNLSGTRITSNKKIAVTIKDDSLQFQGCMDLTGDQMVPVNIIGKEYIVVKGSLNVQDKVIILPVSNGTTVSINGTPAGTYNAGQTFEYNLTVPSIYIETSAPVYVYHYTGFGCELGSAIVPPIKCTGARSMSAVRSTNEYFGVIVFSLTSAVNSFMVNGNPSLLTAANFTVVPGTGGMYSGALVDFSGTIGTGVSVNITNSMGLFHAGIINGGASSGCRYGFFSDYSRIELASQIVKPISCFNGNDGQMMVEMLGGLAPYTYLWSNGQTTQTATNLTQGTYKVTVTDASNCKDSVLNTITHPTIITGTVFPTNIINNCIPETSTGSAIVTATGGTPAYRYSLDGTSFQAGSQFTGLAEGQYTARIKDSYGCVETVDFVILDPPNDNPLHADLVTTSIVNNCQPNGNTGRATVSAAGGYVPYTYSLNGGTYVGNGGVFTGLASGNQYIVVKDANGCTDTVYFTINNPLNNTALTATVNAAGITHNCLVGGTTGSATVTLAGGFTPYRVSLNGGPYTTDYAFTNLASGNHTVNVLDSNGCTATATFTVTDPPNATALAATVNATDIVHNCLNNGTQGTATVTTTGGYLPYRYSLDGGTAQTSAAFTGLASGNHTVTVTDANGCTATATFTVTDPPNATELAATVNATDIVHNCLNNGTQGTAAVTTTGGYVPYSYVLDGGTAQTSAAFPGLASGNHTVTVTDANGCTATATFTVTDPPNATELAATVNATDIVHNCLNNGTQGTAAVTTTGGYIPYRYSLDGGTAQTSNAFAGLASGNHTVTVTDANGCTTTATFTVTDPPNATELAATVNATDIVHNCLNNGTQGTAAVTTTGGYIPYRYSLDGGAAQASAAFTGLASGNHTVTVTDANGCTATATFTVTDPPNATELAATVNPVDIVHNCLNNGTQGTAAVTTAGGYVPYRYSLDGGTAQASAAFTGLASGNHTVTVTDANGCTATTTFTVTDPPNATELAATVNATDIVHNCLNNGTQGTAAVTTTGGYVPYSYVLDGGTAQASNAFAGLASGNHTVTVTDANGCTKTVIFTVTDPPNGQELSAILDISAISCHGLSDGKITARPAGGYPGYTYLWAGGETTATISGLGLGNYSVSVTDANGCQTNLSGTITQPAAPLSVTLNTSSNVNCFGNLTGSISVSASGGTTAYSYLWSNGATTAQISGLAAGTYTLTVTDANGCTENTFSATITQPQAALALSGTVTQVKCFQGNDGAIDANVSGGTAPYQYQWNSGQATEDLAALSAGNYVLAVTDANGCTATYTATVTQGASELVSAPTQSNPTCNGFADGSVILAVSGGEPAYTYQWSNGMTTQNITGLTAGNYAVTYTDNRGCQRAKTFVLTEPTPVLVQGTVQDNKCYGVTDGSISVNISGGSPNYTLQWSNGLSVNPIANLAPGSYGISVRDANGCQSNASFSVFPASPLELMMVQAETIFIGDRVELTADVTGGTGNYTFQWTPENTLECPTCRTTAASPVRQTQYQVYVTDGNGCQIEGHILVRVNQDIFVPNAFTPGNNGINDTFKPVVRMAKECSFSIFDRWGEKIYSTNDADLGWDGTLRGTTVPADVYVYRVDVTFLNGESKTLHGNVVLLR